MIVRKYKITKEKLLSIPIYKRNLFLQLIKLLTEINILYKQYYFSFKNIESEQNVAIRDSKFSMALLNATLLAGKLCGGWEILCPTREMKQQNPGLAVDFDPTKEPDLGEKGKKAFKDLKHYFSDRKNLIKRCRNKYSYHNDIVVDENLKGVDDNDEYYLYTSEQCLNWFTNSSNIYFTNNLKISDSNSNNITIFFADVLRMTEQFRLFNFEYICLVRNEYFKENIDEIELPKQLKKEDINLPFFTAE